MKTTATIHWNKGKVARAHNRREKELCEHEEHIDLYNEMGDSFCDILLDRKLEDVYEEVFGEAIDEFNAKQKRKDRMKSIESYMAEVENDNRGKKQTKKVNGKAVVDEDAERQGKSTEYEVTIHAGNTEREKGEDGRVLYDESGHHIRPEYLPRDLQRKIQKEYCDTFQEENPNFILTSMTIHGDEFFENKMGVKEYDVIHSQITFVPIAHGFKQGLSVQNSMNRALKEMGFGGNDAYEQWAKKEQARLEDITLELYNEYCLQNPNFAREHGDLEFYHPVSMKMKKGDKTKEEHAREQEFEEHVADTEADLSHTRNLLQSQASKYLDDKRKWQEAVIATEIELNQERYNQDCIAYMQAQQEQELAQKEKDFQEQLESGKDTLHNLGNQLKIHIGTLQKMLDMGDNKRASRMFGFMEKFKLGDGRSLADHFKDEEPNIIREEDKAEAMMRSLIAKADREAQRYNRSRSNDFDFEL